MTTQAYILLVVLLICIDVLLFISWIIERMRANKYKAKYLMERELEAKRQVVNQ